MADIQPGRTVAGKYRVVKRLSYGGMGSVWLAHHLHLDAPVALKFMRPSMVQDPSARARFEREAKAAAQIRSPHVVQMYDHGIDGGTPFIVMEFLEGEDLRTRLKGKRRLAPAEAVRVCNEVCKGLQRAHELGIVHRDLKPGNLYLSVPDDDMVKILDFGIAKETGNKRVVRGETTTTGQLLGSPHYLSPEQARGQPLDGRSDLWSLTVILFRALSGKRPFDGQDIGDLIVRICTDPVPPISGLRPELGSAVDAFFERGFQRDPSLRFQSAKELATAFAAALAGADEVPIVEKGSWDAGDSSVQDAPVAWDEAPTTMTPSGGARASGSSRFGNVAIGQMTPDDEKIPTHTPHPDTFAATTSPVAGRRALLGGVLAVVALVTIAGLVVALGDSGDGEPVAPAATASVHEPPEPPPTTTAVATTSEPVVEDVLVAPKTAEPAAPPSSPPVGPAARAKAKPPAPQPVAERPRPAPPPPPAKPKVDLGY